MWTITTSREHAVLVVGVVELGMIRQQHVCIHGGRLLRHLLLRVDVGLEVPDPRHRCVVDEVERGAAGVRDVHRAAAVERRERIGQRSWRVTRRQPDGHGPAAERDLHPVGRDDIPLWRHRLVAVREFRDSVPVGRAHDDTRAVFLLQDLRAADVIGVRVRNDDVFDLLRVETELLHPADDQLLGVVRKDRVDQDDAVARRQRPGRVDLAADKIEVVEDLRRLGVPRLALRRLRRIGDVIGNGVAVVLASALGQQARADERAEELEAGGVLRGLYGRSVFGIEVSCGGTLLREHARRESDQDRQRRTNARLPQ